MQRSPILSSVTDSLDAHGSSTTPPSHDDTSKIPSLTLMDLANAATPSPTSPNDKTSSYEVESTRIPYHEANSKSSSQSIESSEEPKELSPRTSDSALDDHMGKQNLNTETFTPVSNHSQQDFSLSMKETHIKSNLSNNSCPVAAAQNLLSLAGSNNSDGLSETDMPKKRSRRSQSSLQMTVKPDGKSLKVVMDGVEVPAFPPQKKGNSKRKVNYDELDHKRREFLERNRQAALKCRQKKKYYIAQMQARMDFYNSHNEALAKQIQAFTEEIDRLKTVITKNGHGPIVISDCKESYF